MEILSNLPKLISTSQSDEELAVLFPGEGSPAPLEAPPRSEAP